MKLYKKKIQEYKSVIQSQYVRESAVEDVIDQCKSVSIEQENIQSSYFEFLYAQCKFIKKKWWVLQGGTLFLLWILINNLESVESLGRIMGTFSVLFSILIIPEIWKNRRFSAVEIERASYYSLRQICAARLLLFAVIDMMMITVFFVFALNTVQLSLSSIITNFLIPFNISSGVCFRMLCSKGVEMEYVAVCLSIALIIVWSVIVANDVIYQAIVEPLWLGLVLMSLAYLVFCVRKSLHNCEFWEVRTNGIRI